MKSHLIFVDIALERRICLASKHLEGKIYLTTLLGIIKLDACQYFDWLCILTQSTSCVCNCS